MRHPAVSEQLTVTSDSDQCRLFAQQFRKHVVHTSLPCLIHLLSACESWTLTAELQRRIRAMKLKCYRKMPRTSCKDHATNEEVHAKIQQSIEPHDDLLTIVKRGKVQWYGHFSRSSGLAKTILRGTVKGGRRQGRQRKRWEEWTGLGLAKA